MIIFIAVQWIFGARITLQKAHTKEFDRQGGNIPLSRAGRRLIKFKIFGAAVRVGAGDGREFLGDREERSFGKGEFLSKSSDVI